MYEHVSQLISVSFHIKQPKNRSSIIFNFVCQLGERSFGNCSEAWAKVYRKKFERNKAKRYKVSEERPEELADVIEISNNLNCSLIVIGFSAFKFQRIGAMRVHSYTKWKIRRKNLLPNKFHLQITFDCNNLVQSITRKRYNNCTGN